MNRRDFLTNDYVPYKLDGSDDLLANHYQTQCERIHLDPENYFERAKITNFDLINKQCRGDELKHDRTYYETLFQQKILKIENPLLRQNFISAAKRSERSDVTSRKVC